MPTPSQDQALAIPTKQFFVSMLTRDINLADAILDLVDNCLDGALRMADGDDVDYSKHFVEIELAAEHFLIGDNCGGIPREVAKNYAFKNGPGPRRRPGCGRGNDRDVRRWDEASHFQDGS